MGDVFEASGLQITCDDAVCESAREMHVVAPTPHLLQCKRFAVKIAKRDRSSLLHYLAFRRPAKFVLLAEAASEMGML